MQFHVETFDKDRNGSFIVEGVVAEQMNILGAGELFFSNGGPENRETVIVYGPRAWRTVWPEEEESTE